jgi:hypothetical protein
VGDNVVKFPDQVPPDEKAWRDTLRDVRAARGGDASRDAELARLLVAMFSKLDNKLPPQPMRLPKSLLSDPVLSGEIKRATEDLFDRVGQHALKVRAIMILEVVLLLTGATGRQDFDPADWGLPSQPPPNSAA